MQNKGLFLVLLTALISGVSIFLNSFAVSGINPFIFTTLKNVVVALFLISLIAILRERRELAKLTSVQWGKLSAIGLVGGSIPFLIFFYALSQTSAINAGFIHKTMFIFISAMAFLFLK